MREAIRSLIAKGLVESRSKIGTRVRPAAYWNYLDADVLRPRLEVTEPDTYLRKMFELRLATEPAASAIAARFADASDRTRIVGAFQAMVAAGSDNLLWLGADLEFHKAIYLLPTTSSSGRSVSSSVWRSGRCSPLGRADRTGRARWQSAEI